MAGHKMTHAGCSIPGSASLCPNPPPSLPPFYPSCGTGWPISPKCSYQISTCGKFMFNHSSWNGKESAWFGSVFFAASSLSSMSSVTVCDKMADSICDRLDHKYTTQPQLIHHLDQEESLSLKLASTQNLFPAPKIYQHPKLFSFGLPETFHWIAGWAVRFKIETICSLFMLADSVLPQNTSALQYSSAQSQNMA